MFERGVAIVYVTRRGSEVAHKIREALERHGVRCTVFAPKKYAREGEEPLSESLKVEMKRMFEKFDAIVGVMAAGVLIRSIAPLLNSKFKDPAVVCVDIAGRFAISLLSGHYRGANRLAKLIANGIGAIAVITTGSEAVGRKSVEEVAEYLHSEILNPEDVVKVNSLIVNGMKVVVAFAGFDHSKLPSNVCNYEALSVQSVEEVTSILSEVDGVILVVRDLADIKTFKMRIEKPIVFLRPKKIVVGIGARRDVSSAEVVEAIKSGLEMAKLPLLLVDSIATIDIKRGSKSITEAGLALGVPVHYVSGDHMKSFHHDDLSPDSEVVKQRIGLGGVCERAALIVAGGRDAKLILKKVKIGRVTLAIAEGK